MMSRIEDIYPLSPLQEGMLYHSLLEPDMGLYIDQLVIRLRSSSEIRADAFGSAWQSAVNRYSTLRTAFSYEEGNKLLQVVLRDARIEAHVIDWRALAANDQTTQLQSLLTADRAAGFDLASAPLARVQLLRASDNEYVILFTYHHMLLDAWSVALVLRHVFAAYRSFPASDASEPPRAYRDYIAWLRNRDVTEEEVFWRDKLEGFENPLVIPNVRPEPTNSHSFGSEKVVLSEETTAYVNAAARRLQTTPALLAEAAWALILNRYTGQEDILFGVTLTCRPPDLPGSANIAGLFINTLPLRIRYKPGESLAEFVGRLKDKQLQLLRFPHVPLHRLQTLAGFSRGFGLFESVFTFENIPGLTDSQAGWGEDIEIVSSDYLCRTNYPLNVIVIPGRQLTLLIDVDIRRCRCGSS
jgi:non-ribosomal peptide synthetase component F